MTTAHYCTADNLTNRLTKAGFEFAANRDGGRTVSAAEIAAYIDPAIERADTEIDAAIWLFYDTTAARGNAWLKYLAVDLATVFALTNGGRAAPENYLDDVKRARDQLAAVHRGVLKIPGLSQRTLNTCVVFPTTSMMVVNPLERRA